MSQARTDHGLGFWARQQLTHDRRVMDAADYAEAVQDERVAVEQGHVSPRMFYAPDEFFDGLDQNEPVARPIWLAKIQEIGDDWLRLGPYQGGFVAGYVAATMQHLQGCPDCQERVIAQLISELQTLQRVRSVLKSAGL